MVWLVMGGELERLQWFAFTMEGEECQGAKWVILHAGLQRGVDKVLVLRV